ncbi:hypothetical protein [Sporosarcina sp. NPDC096371]|uniref:hypothetical protein n=1 Tax=Sporosarcina sp. NPDC096371 TaxID=3364530 RepID=UPI00380F903F
MKGKHLAIGLILFVILGSLVIYLTMTATFNKDMNGMESIVSAIDEMDYRL